MGTETRECGDFAMKPGNVYWINFGLDTFETEVLRVVENRVEHRLQGGLRLCDTLNEWGNRKPVYLGRAKKFLGFRYGLDPVPESQT